MPDCCATNSRGGSTRWTRTCVRCCTPAGPPYLTTAVANATTPADTASAERYVAAGDAALAHVIAMQDALRLGHARGSATRACGAGARHREPPGAGHRRGLARVAGPRAQDAAAASESLKAVRAGGARDVVDTELRPRACRLGRVPGGPASDGARDTVVCTDAARRPRPPIASWSSIFTTSSRTPGRAHDGTREAAAGGRARRGRRRGRLWATCRYRQTRAGDIGRGPARTGTKRSASGSDG